MVRQALVMREHARLTADFHHLAVTDGLTGLTNRRHLLELAERAFERCRRRGIPLAAIMVDVDHFKTINDTHGHAIGDLVLTTVAMQCRQELRAGDLLGRYGGDELIVLLPGSSPEDALHAAQRLRAAVSGTPIEVGTVLVPVTLSLGVTPAEQCTDLDELLARADTALYEAKAAGRDCARLYAS
jgi:diguanylate cyclase (GGDEF)-like protein